MRPKATHLYGACSQGADDRRRDYHHGRPAGREPMPLVPGGCPGHWVRDPFGDRQAMVPHKPDGGRSASWPTDCGSSPGTQELDTMAVGWAHLHTIPSNSGRIVQHGAAIRGSTVGTGERDGVGVHTSGYRITAPAWCCTMIALVMAHPAWLGWQLRPARGGVVLSDLGSGHHDETSHLQKVQPELGRLYSAVPARQSICPDPISPR